MGGEELPPPTPEQVAQALEWKRQRLRTRITRWLVALLLGSLLAGIWVGDARWLWTAFVLFWCLVVAVAPNYEAGKAEVARRAEGSTKTPARPVPSVIHNHEPYETCAPGCPLYPGPGRPNPSGRT